MTDIELTPLGPNDHTRGPADAGVTLIEYADFECPYCREAHAVVVALEKRLAGRLRFVFRHFPLREMHPHAEPAAEAAEAAAAQGKFWEMHDALFSDRHPLDTAGLRAHAHDAGIPDLARFERETADERYGPVLDAAIENAEASGVEGTPMFFINGRPFEDEPSLELLGAALEAELASTARQ